MDKEETLKELLKDSTVLKLDSITTVNHRPHPYCITVNHLKYNDSQELGGSQINRMEKEHGPMCGMYVNSESGEFSNTQEYGYGWSKCDLPYKDHHGDEVAFIKLKKDSSQEEVGETLKHIVDSIGKDLIDGFVFVENEFKVIK